VYGWWSTGTDGAGWGWMGLDDEEGGCRSLTWQPLAGNEAPVSLAMVFVGRLEHLPGGGVCYVADVGCKGRSAAVALVWLV
jgi:CubicO group peptidase (beta-lactamase class C family)